MMGTINCIYETPCGWCSKWDKECDKKIAWQGNKVKCEPADTAIDTSLIETVELCTSESDHDWKYNGIDSRGTTYICKKCHAQKIEYIR